MDLHWCECAVLLLFPFQNHGHRGIADSERSHRFRIGRQRSLVATDGACTPILILSKNWLIRPFVWVLAGVFDGFNIYVYIGGIREQWLFDITHASVGHGHLLAS